MQRIEIKALAGAALKNSFEVVLKGYTAIRYSNDIGNCKHCYLHSVGGRLTDIYMDGMDRVFDRVGKLTFTVTPKQMQDIQNLQKRYTLIAMSKIPIGYNNGYQLHATFFTNTDYPDRAKYLRKFKQESENHIPGAPITDEQIDKIMSYKSKHFCKKYLEKLIS
tara:strand:- start:65238 stop:65729 length:492 start_codon:yes stop_codon:yes gene_type:complete